MNRIRRNRHSKRHNRWTPHCKPVEFCFLGKVFCGEQAEWPRVAEFAENSASASGGQAEFSQIQLLSLRRAIHSVAAEGRAKSTSGFRGTPAGVIADRLVGTLVVGGVSDLSSPLVVGGVSDPPTGSTEGLRSSMLARSGGAVGRLAPQLKHSLAFARCALVSLVVGGVSDPPTGSTEGLRSSMLARSGGAVGRLAPQLKHSLAFARCALVKARQLAERVDAHRQT